MNVLRYGEKVIGAGPTASGQVEEIRCSAENCTEPSNFHADLRGSSRRTVEFCSAHMQEARSGDVEFDRQLGEFLAKGSNKSFAEKHE